jgi:hypothetical protein
VTLFAAHRRQHYQDIEGTDIHPEAVEWQVFFLLTLFVRKGQQSLSAGSFQPGKIEFLRISGIRVLGKDILQGSIGSEFLEHVVDAYAVFKSGGRTIKVFRYL